MSQAAIGGEARGERRSGGRGRRAGRRLGCMDWFIPFQGDYTHPASPDGAPGNAAAPSVGSVFTAGSSAAQKESWGSGSVTRSRTPCWSVSRSAATFHRFIKHVLHVESAPGDVRVKTPIHPVRHGTLPYSTAHTPILTVCVWRVFHTNRGNSPGGAGAGPRPVGYARRVWRGSPATGRNGVGRPGNSIPANPLCSGPMGYPLTRPARLDLDLCQGRCSRCAFITPMRVGMTSCRGRIPAAY